MLASGSLRHARPHLHGAAWTHGPCRRAAVACRAGAVDPKKDCARLFVDEFVRNGSLVGLGTGSLSVKVIEEIGQRLAKRQLEGVRGVATGLVAATEAAFHGVPLVPENSEGLRVDVAFETADQLDVARSAAIIGVKGEPQQPALLRSLAMAQTQADKFVLLVEPKDMVPQLGGVLPVLIESEGWEECAEEVDDLVIGDAEVWRRAVPGTPNPNPRGGDNPYTSPEGHHLLDLKFEGGFKLFGEDTEYAALEDALLDIEGVVATGMLLGVASAAVVADPSGARVVQLATAQVEFDLREAACG
eukprot:CAMPEP_0202859272 /NCGR_PEP_ID=MMETSP1391-20130828/1462_1 /ASSEMBLY_ACC=CAM_ASM_000867 /TAXON_ID=1034604 /ORGANISM="Chlamydomonas leiostraca, Strain SAG 11-49" /LENGTH=301 /DNA_ID=CAMNT_0049538295 /DNA_START=28 /DNA_END=931 /DNA_ORIENTATION=+